MRCTHPKVKINNLRNFTLIQLFNYLIQDKAMAMGIIQFSIGLLSNIPCPNIYGHLIDATCMVWSKICGVDGYCALYDSDSFRTHFFGELQLIAFK
jgi:hypothetical protein